MTKNYTTYVFSEPVNLGRSFSGLLELVRRYWRIPVVSGTQFLFFNSRRDYLKAIRYDGTGFVILAKKLDAGVFPPCASKLTQKQVEALLEGCATEHVAA
ncbi:MAG: IS66 family insertion sequence element accessory protein TnpB [Candidatus Obscuribacterales bacterium]